MLQSDDSMKDKLLGSVENAVVFALYITAATFVLFLLFKHRFSGFIWGYMGFVGFLIFGVLGGSVGLEVLQKLDIALDVITVSIVLWNVTLGGVLTTFFWPAPLFVKQGYLVMVSAISSFSLSRIPEWTTWSILIVMSLYDLYAVLTPSGPLKLIVELAEEREEDIPALVYETRESWKVTHRRSYASKRGARTHNGSVDEGDDEEVDDDDGEDDTFSSIKLGLGDFIFYSLLVGRAALYSPITCAFCFIAVLAGLILTLIALGRYGKALPALPISIALGVATYFLSRFLIEPALVRSYAREYMCDIA
jgi:presenilin 1